MALPLNRTTAPQVIRLLDYCFKMGVLDAYEAGDDFMVKDWVEARKEDGKYGLLADPDVEYDWRRWRFTLFRWCRLLSLTRAGEGYIDRIRNKNNFLFAVLPISMHFYLMGAQEWLDYPNPANITIFKNTLRIHWKPMPQSYLRTMRTDDFISYIQEYIYSLQSNPREDDIPISKYNSFCVALWKFTRKYITYGEIRDDIEAEEDL